MLHAGRRKLPTRQPKQAHSDEEVFRHGGALDEPINSLQFISCFLEQYIKFSLNTGRHYIYHMHFFLS
jgi:hypothetical protein